MATRKYKFILLKDPDVSSHQSRGLSIQVNGFAPVADVKGVIGKSLGLGEVPNIAELVASDDVVLLFRDVKYLCDDSGTPTPADVNYKNYKSQPGLHMFQGVRTEAADELSYDTEEGTTRSQIIIEFPLYSSMFGNRIDGRVGFQGIVLYGQAYNAEFYDETAQGKLQDAVPVGLLWFESPYEIDPITTDSRSATTTTFRVAIGLRAGVDITDSYIESNPEYASAYSGFQGSFHVVNNNMTTSSAFVLRGRDVIPMKDSNFEGYERVPLPEAGATIDFASRVFFTNEPPGNDNDHNVDFGSPARLTIFNTESACSGSMRIPQTLIGKVSYSTDEDLYKHAYWDGVAESFYAAGEKTGGNETTSGSCYDIDWISKKKPALSIFSVDNNFVSQGIINVVDVENKDHTIYLQGDPKLSDGRKFANGTNILSEESQSVGDGVNVNAFDTKTRGNAMVLNSSEIKSYTHGVTADDDYYGKDDPLYRYDAFIANSKDIGIFTEVKGTNNRETRIQNQLNTVIGSKSVRVLSLYDRGTQKGGKNLVLGTSNSDLQLVNNTQFIGCDNLVANEVENATIIGSTGNHKVFQNSKQVNLIGTAWSRVGASERVSAIGGMVSFKGARDSVIISTPLTDQDNPNKIHRPTNNRYLAHGCFILGSNNSIELEGSDQYSVYLIGEGLTSDHRNFSEDMRHTTYRRPSFILGQNNSMYYEPDTFKTIIIGGQYVKAGSSDVSPFKYNSFEHYVAKTTVSSVKGTKRNVESIDSLTDVKGRKIKYTSNGIELSFLRDDATRSTESYDNYVFKGCGRINLFKLYQLLHRMYWDYDGTVKFDWLGTHPGTTDTWLDQKAGWHSWDVNGDTNLANLVDDNLSCFPYSPMK
jgi:hypothetical protein